VLKLYKLSDTRKEYWETWSNDDGSHTVHWGELGTIGQSKAVTGSFLKKAKKIIKNEVADMISRGFKLKEDEFTLLIEYPVEGMGSNDDLDKRHRLEKKLNETLGWTGLGNCDGGSIGTGAMDVCTFVVDFEVAKTVIENDLKGTEFEGYTRIYDENAE